MILSTPTKPALLARSDTAEGAEILTLLHEVAAAPSGATQLGA